MILKERMGMQKCHLKENDLYNNYDEKLKSLNPKYNKQISILNKDRVWEIMDKSLQRDIKSIQESIVKHIEYTLAISRFDIKRIYIPRYCFKCQRQAT